MTRDSSTVSSVENLAYRFPDDVTLTSSQLTSTVMTANQKMENDDGYSKMEDVERY